jgi:hypothetical protein
LTLASLRLGHPADYAKGAHYLPGEITGQVEEALVRTLDSDELSRALRAATLALLGGLRANDPEVAETLTQPLLDMLS